MPAEISLTMHNDKVVEPYRLSRQVLRAPILPYPQYSPTIYPFILSLFIFRNTVTIMQLYSFIFIHFLIQFFIVI